MRILIAEDDDLSRRMLEIFLGKWGYEVEITTNGEQAWASFQRENAPALALLDVMMPGLDGLEICRRVRALPLQTPPYLILLTAKSRKEDVVAGIEAGANDYLTKPFHSEELRVRLGVGRQMVELQARLADRVRELEGALEQVKQLQGIIPICSYCKSIRDDQNYWQQVESYVSSHSGAQFSHSVCPPCYEKVVQPALEALRG